MIYSRMRPTMLTLRIDYLDPVKALQTLLANSHI